ncbi:glycosyltransferase [Vibrio parahaemolyticus]|uniref:Uncharacterized protein n=1 Tax=Vibrio parahaemolyticus TaxID=670 RepID=A0A7M1VVG3_VIBPH|nr:glycosyltransferase [Vibrio parahaemolyticus]MDF4645879.1 glycosyltransferase [Vibrio parahaemolyticus]QOS19202.1 hypothetical protein VP48_00026 [Vibrio parahaemolyticus]HCG7390064.1 glycosyltransferase [Vibrio parahaemolyticus]
MKSVHVVNMAENSRTRRAQRHVVLFNKLRSLGFTSWYYTSRFDHASKRSLSPSSEDFEVDIWIPGYRSHTGIMRMISNCIFAVQLYFCLSKRVSSGDLVIVSSIPTELPFVATLLKVFRKDIEVAIDVRDIWPDSFPGQGVKKSVFSFYCNVLNKLSFRKSDYIVYVNRDFKKFLNSLGVQENKSKYIPLGADLSRWSKSSSNEVSKVSSRFVYVGNFNKQFDLTALGESFLKDNEHELVFIGDGELAEKYHGIVPNANFMGYLKPEEVVAELKECKVGLLPITGKATLPNKIYDYILSGLDILTNSEEVARALSLVPVERLEGTSCYYIRNIVCDRSFIVDYEQVSEDIIEYLNVRKVN